MVEGRLQLRDWTDKNGNKRRSAEVIVDNVYFGDSKKDGDGGSYQQGGGYPQDGHPQGGYQQSSYGENYGGAPAQGSQSYLSSDYGGFQETGDDDGDLPF